MTTALLHRKNRNGSNSMPSLDMPLRDLSIFNYDPFSRFFSQLDPEINVLRTEHGFEVEIPVAGFKPDDVDITVKEQIVTVAAKNDRRAFTRSLRLPEDIDPDNIEAKIEDGLLCLTLCRYPETEPRKIRIKTPSRE